MSKIKEKKNRRKQECKEERHTERKETKKEGETKETPQFRGKKVKIHSYSRF